MPHVNIQHPETGMWRCWSTIVDNWITDWMTESDYKEYLIQEAADSVREDLNNSGIRTSRFITYNDCIYDSALREFCDKCPNQGDFDKCDMCDKNITVEEYIEQGDDYLNICLIKEDV